MGSRLDRCGVFILTHGRPDRVHTYGLLRTYGYTGPIYLLVDDEDKALPEYLARYGDQVYTFSKAAVAATFDTADQGRERRSVVFARNAAFPLAAELGYDYLLQLDDDYVSLALRWLTPDGKADYRNIKGLLNEAFEQSLAFLDTGLDVFAWCQGGDLIGGANAHFRGRVLRKAMNVLFMRANTPIRFLGTINEDVNTYVLLGTRGRLFLTDMRLQMAQLRTQSNPGGMSGLYVENGTYLKSFYTVMMAPASARVALLRGGDTPRIHHQITWNHTAPKILSDAWRKPR